MNGGESAIENRSACAQVEKLAVERLGDHAARELVERLEVLLARLETLPDQPARELALETVEALVRLYGEGLARMVDRLVGSTDRAPMQQLSHDELVSHLLLLHDLHPDSVDVRVRRALDDVLPSLRSHGTDAELVDVVGDVAHVRLRRDGHGCASTSRTLMAMVEDALLRAAPEVSRVEMHEVAASTPALVTISGRRALGTASQNAGDVPAADGTARRASP